MCSKKVQPHFNNLEACLNAKCIEIIYTVILHFVSGPVCKKNTMFESHENVTLSAAILYPAVCITDPMNQASMCGKSIRWSGIAQLVEHPTEKARHNTGMGSSPQCGKGFFSQSASSADPPMVSTQPMCASTCIVICVHVKNPKRPGAGWGGGGWWVGGWVGGLMYQISSLWGEYDSPSFFLFSPLSFYIRFTLFKVFQI